MKTLYSSLLLALVLFIGNHAGAQCNPITVCFNDDAGFTFKFSNPKLIGVNVYSAEGTCNAYAPGGPAFIRLDLTNGVNGGKVKISVQNPNPDGCFSFSDSFVYVGTVNIIKGSDGRVTSFSGSGDWTSFCFGGPLFTGTWAAQGPCGSGGTAVKQTGVLPVYGKQKITDMKGVTLSPNPTNTLTTIKYGVKEAGKVNITVYNSMKQPVKVIVDEMKTPGNYSAQWNLLNTNGTKVSAGVYRVVVTTGSAVSSGSLQVIGN